MKISIKVRAKSDGHYGGYYRIGPHLDENDAMVPGEVFEIDARPKEALDEHGKPMQEYRQNGRLDANNRPMLEPVWVIDSNGKPKRDSATGELIPKIKMTTAFSPNWMEPVNEDATVDYPDQGKAFGVLPQMLPPKVKAPVIASRPIALPAEVASVIEKEVSPI